MNDNGFRNAFLVVLVLAISAIFWAESASGTVPTSTTVSTTSTAK